MIDIQETDLPGVGKKYTLEETANGDKISVVVHMEGKREIYLFEGKSEDPTSVMAFTDEEARKIGAILEGAFFRPIPTEELEKRFEELLLEWYPLKADYPCVNKSISEIEIRRRSGASVIAIIRGSHTIPNPHPSTRVKEGDTLVVLGTREQQQKFKDLIKGQR